MKLILPTLLVLALPVSARVGETVEELKKRFKAAPVEQPSPGGVTTFTFTGEKQSTVTAFTVKGTVLKEIYTNVTRADADTIMKDQGAGWKVSFDAEGIAQWKGPKGLEATFHGNALVVIDGRFTVIERQVHPQGQ